MSEYISDVDRGELKREPNQEHCIRQLDSLLGQLGPYNSAVQRHVPSLCESSQYIQE